jgi:hypothetical protein
MIEASLVGRHISEFAHVLGFPVIVPDRPPESDPEYGLDRYIEFPDRGFAILVDWNDKCSCVQFFSGEKEPPYAQYEGELPKGLGFTSTRPEVRNAMGQAVDGRDSGDVYPLKFHPWDWFIQHGMKVHFAYSDECDRVLMVSVMPLPD